jgi:hypothetical protein
VLRERGVCRRVQRCASRGMEVQGRQQGCKGALCQVLLQFSPRSDFHEAWRAVECEPVGLEW